ncbi:11252_t:CDS:1, partial [Racocetra fulgida]
NLNYASKAIKDEENDMLIDEKNEDLESNDSDDSNNNGGKKNIKGKKRISSSDETFQPKRRK